MELITLILTPLIIVPITQLLKKQTKVPPEAIVAFLSAIGGSLYLIWNTVLSEEMKAWFFAAYPIFFFGSTMTYKFLKPFLEKK